MTKLTQEIVRELYIYNPHTGELINRTRPRHYFRTERGYKMWNTKYSHKCAGSQDTKGYMKTMVLGKLRYVHRLIWLYVTGKMPVQIDHINQNPSDNRWINLREVSQSENMKNKKLHRESKTGCNGVTWHKRIEKFQVKFTIDYQQFHFGYFDTIEEARKEALKRQKELGFHKNHGNTC